jgi:trans-2,3-dihydro-3-hydroxyanthranilate isomerase
MGISRYRYLHYDVFTERRFGGNQLAVFPEAAGLSGAMMQQIAKEIGFAETTFVFPAESADTNIRMRIFTPAIEMPMAGHPVVGSTFALGRERRIPAGTDRWVFGLNVGPLPVDIDWQGPATSPTMSFVRMTQALPQFGSTFDAVDVAGALALPISAIHSTNLPIQQVSCGVPFVMVPVATRADVDAATPDPRAFDALARKIAQPHFSVYLFSTAPAQVGHNDARAASANNTATVYTRMFAPGMGVYEDPATGSASGPLGCYLVKHSVIPEQQAGSIVNLQGVKLGRPSWIHIAIDVAAGQISRVRVGGTSVFVAEGAMEVED